MAKGEAFVGIHCDPSRWVADLKNRDNTMWSAFWEHLHRGRTFWEFDTKYKAFSVKNHRLLLSYQVLYEFRPGVNTNVCMKWNGEAIVEKVRALPEGTPSRAVGLWLVDIFLTPYERRPKVEKNLWLHSDESNVGKTSLVQALERYANVYQANCSTIWFDDYRDQWYGAWVFDEFTGDGVCWGIFNKIAGNSGCPLPRRGRNGVVRRDMQVPVIVLSNYSIEYFFYRARPPRSVTQRTMMTRFQEVEVPEGGDIFPLLGLLDMVDPKSTPRKYVGVHVGSTVENREAASAASLPDDSPSSTPSIQGTQTVSSPRRNKER